MGWLVILTGASMWILIVIAIGFGGMIGFALGVAAEVSLSSPNRKEAQLDRCTD